MIDTFNQVYEALLKEVNIGISTLPIVNQYRDIAVKNWTKLLQLIPDENINIKRFSDDNPDISQLLRSGIMEKMVGPDGLTWNIKYIVVIGSTNENFIYYRASFGGSPFVDEFRTKISNGELKNKTDFRNYLFSKKRELNEKVGCGFILFINDRSRCNAIHNKIADIKSLALHESSHMYDYMIMRDKLPTTQDKYDYALQNNTNLEDYYINVEIVAFTSSVIQELQEIKDKIRNGEINNSLSLKDALRMCKTWMNGYGEYLSQSEKDKLRKKIMVKLNYFWTTK
jgi:hypothetical protein